MWWKAILMFIFLLLVVALGIGTYLYRAAKKNIHDINLVCSTSLGTPIKKVIQLGRKLNFKNFENSALGEGFIVKTKSNEEIDGWDDRVFQIDSGQIILGKTYNSPFGRGYCFIEFSNGVVTKIEKKFLD